MTDDRNYTYGYKSIPQARRTLTTDPQEPRLSNRRSKLGRWDVICVHVLVLYFRIIFSRFMQSNS